MNELLLEGSTSENYLKLSADPSTSAYELSFPSSACTETQVWAFDATGNIVCADQTGGSGSGELNNILNPSAQSNTDGWVANGTASVSQVDSGSETLPLEPVIETALSIQAGTSADVVRYRFPMADKLKNVKQKVQFYWNTDGVTVDDEFQFALYTNTASDYSGTYTQVTFNGGDTDVPLKAAGGRAIRSFDAGDESFYELRFITPANGGFVKQLLLQNVIVGPGAGPFVVPRGAEALVSVYGSTDQTGLTSGTSVKIDFDTENYDKNGDFNTSTNTFTAPLDGKYLINAQALLQPETPHETEAGYVKLIKNGSDLIRGTYSQLNGTDAAFNTVVSVSTGTFELQKGDEITFEAFLITTTGTWKINHDTRFTYLSIDLVEADSTSVNIFSTSDTSPVAAGTVMAWMASTVPDGWLECDGSAISRSQYSELFEIIGTTYGAGDGSTTFNLPDLRGYVLRGQDNGAGVDPDAASRTNRGDGTTGDNVGTKQGTAIEEHSHQLYAANRDGGGGASNGNLFLDTAGFATTYNGNNGPNNFVDNSNLNASTTINSAETSTETRMKNVAVKWIIKTTNGTSSGLVGFAGATAEQGGLVTTGEQTFAGAKTLNNDLTVTGQSVEAKIILDRNDQDGRVELTSGTSGGFVDIYDNTDTRTVRIAPSGDSYLNGGNVGIGTSSPSGELEVADSAGNANLIINGATGSDSFLRLYEGGSGRWSIYNDASDGDKIKVADSGGNDGVEMAQNANAWSALSDERYKENWVELDGALNKIKTLRAGTYNNIYNPDNLRKVGLIAQDVLKVLPEAVDTDNPDKLTMRYTDVVPLLTKAIQEQQAIIEDLKQRIEDLEQE